MLKRLTFPLILLMIALTALPLIALADDHTDDEDYDYDYVLTYPDLNPDFPVSTVIFTHNSIDTGAVDLYLNGVNDPVVTDLGYGETTTFINIPGGQQVFIARPAGSGADGEQLAALDWDFMGNSTWLVAASGLSSEVAFQLEPINVLRTDYDDMARIRVVNFVPNNSRVSLGVADGDLIGDGLGWYGVGDAMLPAGTTTFNGFIEDSALDDITLDLEEDTTYLMLVSGDPAGTYPYAVTVVEAPEYTSNIRFINNSSNTVDLYARPMDMVLIEDFEAGATTEFYALPTGAMTFVLYAPDDAPDGRELASLPFQFDAYEDYTITYTDNGFEITEVIFNPMANIPMMDDDDYDDEADDDDEYYDDDESDEYDDEDDQGEDEDEDGDDD